MPRSEKPDPRPPGGRRVRSASVPAEGDLFATDSDRTPDPPSEAAPPPKRRPARKRSDADPAQALNPAPDAPAAATEAGPVRKRRTRGSAEPIPAPAPPAQDDALVRAEADAEPEPATEPEPAPEPEPDGHEDAETDQPRPVPTSPVLLSPDEVLLQKVEPRSFRPNERNDSWLYWLTDRSRADAALRDGMAVEPDAPLLLSDRRAVLPKLAVLAEDPDWAPNAIAVLRLRRIAVEPFLQPGPEPDSYVLAGAANVSA